jgi:hypothetical protein
MNNISEIISKPITDIEGVIADFLDYLQEYKPTRFAGEGLIDELKRAFILSFDVEFSRLDSAMMVDAGRFVLWMANNFKLYTSLNQDAIVLLRETVFANNANRELVHCTMDRFLIEIGDPEGQTYSGLLDSLSHMVHVSTNQATLTPVEYRPSQNVASTPSEVRQFLQTNSWFVGCIMFYLTMKSTPVSVILGLQSKQKELKSLQIP